MITMLDIFKLDPEKPLVYIEMTGTHAAVATLEEELLQSAPANFKIAYLHLKNANKQPHVTYGYATQDTVKEETLNALVSHLTLKAHTVNKKASSKSRLFGVYFTKDDMADLINHHSTIDDLVDEGRLETFETNFDEVTTFGEDFNRQLAKICYQERLV